MNHSAFCAGLVLADPAVREIWLVAGEAHGKISLVFVYVGGFEVWFRASVRRVGSAGFFGQVCRKAFT